MKPLASRRLVSPSPQKRACTLSVSKAALERRLGEPALYDEEGDGLGPRYRWESTCECGLELFVELPVSATEASPEAPEASLWMEHLEVDHALAHLGLSPREVLWRADMQHPLSLDGWALVREDAHGRRHDLCVMPQRAHAECLARLMVRRDSKQLISVEPRGRPSRQGWALIRQDEHGNHYEVAVHPRRRPARRVAS
jgi:hypothetical protein